MICPNCGFQNVPGDAFCGSCGQFLEWVGEDVAEAPPGGQPTDETVVQPAGRQSDQPTPAGSAATAPPPPPAPPTQQPTSRAARHSARPQRAEGPPRMARPTPSGVSYGAITCWNCGRRNSASRSFCQQCGERLSVGSLGGAYEGGGSGGRGKMLAIGLAVVAALLLAGGAAALFLGEWSPSATPAPTGAAVVTGSPPAPTSGATLPPTGAPTVAPTEAPSAPPTEPPTEVPVTPPPATPVNCASSSVPTHWVNLSGRNTSERVRRNEVWCIHQVIIVPDPSFGDGRIRLRANDGVLAQVTHNASSAQSEYPFEFSPAQLVAGRQDVLYRMNCATDFCNAVIQVGYEVLPQNP